MRLAGEFGASNDSVAVSDAGAALAGVLAIAVSTSADATALASRPIGAATLLSVPSDPHGQKGVIDPALYASGGELQETVAAAVNPIDHTARRMRPWR